jgi:hypothetical protein
MAENVARRVVIERVDNNTTTERRQIRQAGGTRTTSTMILGNSVGRWNLLLIQHLGFRMILKVVVGKGEVVITVVTVVVVITTTTTDDTTTVIIRSIGTIEKTATIAGATIALMMTTTTTANVTDITDTTATRKPTEEGADEAGVEAGTVIIGAGGAPLLLLLPVVAEAPVAAVSAAVEVVRVPGVESREMTQDLNQCFSNDRRNVLCRVTI